MADTTELLDVPDDIPEEFRQQLLAPNSSSADFPIMQDPDGGTTVLPRGIKDDRGIYHTKVVFRELNGRDEEYLSKYTDETQLFDAVIERGVERIGSLVISEMNQSERSGTLNSLLVGEKNILFTGVLRCSFGNERNIDWVCVNCGADNETTVLLDTDLKVEIPEELDDSYIYVDSKDRKIQFRGMTGADAALVKPSMNAGMQASTVLAQVILSVNGEMVLSPEKFVSEMLMRDRRKLMALVSKYQPVIDTDVAVSCPSCGREQTSPLSWGELFLV